MYDVVLTLDACFHLLHPYLIRRYLVLLTKITFSDIPAYDVCLRLKDAGLLAKPTHGQTIRLAPPLVITEAQIHEGVAIIREVFNSFNK